MVQFLAYNNLTNFKYEYDMTGNGSYRVNRQCCPGGNRPETPRRPPGDPPQGSPDFLAKSLANPDKRGSLLGNEEGFTVI